MNDYIFFLPFFFMICISLSLSRDSGAIWHFYYSGLRNRLCGWTRDKQTNESNDSQNLSRRFISRSISLAEEIILSARTPEPRAKARASLSEGTKFIFGLFYFLLLYRNSRHVRLLDAVRLAFPQHCRCVPANGCKISRINKNDNAADVYGRDPERVALHRKDTRFCFRSWLEVCWATCSRIIPVAMLSYSCHCGMCYFCSSIRAKWFSIWSTVLCIAIKRPRFRACSFFFFNAFSDNLRHKFSSWFVKKKHSFRTCSIFKNIVDTFPFVHVIL